MSPYSYTDRRQELDGKCSYSNLRGPHCMRVQADLAAEININKRIVLGANQK